MSGQVITGRHTLSDHSLMAFARGGAHDIGQLANARMSRTMLLLAAVVRAAERYHHSRADTTRQLYHTLGEIQRAAPDAVRALLGYPTVAIWALRTATRLYATHPGSVRLDHLAGIVAAAAVRGAITADLDLGPCDGGRLVLPSLGTATMPGEGAARMRLRIGRHAAELTTARATVTLPGDIGTDAPGWLGIRRIRCEQDGRTLDVLLDGELNTHVPKPLRPIRRLADPDDIAAWRERLDASWRLLVRHHPAAAAETGAVLTVVAPLPARPVQQQSCTLRDAYGAVIMSLPRDDRSGAVMLAHETQHAKLSVVMDMTTLVDPTYDGLFYAPWRADRRPPHALLQGLYAHLGVAGFWRRQYEIESDPDLARHAEVEFVRWRAASREAATALLGSGALTDRGREFVSTTAAVLDTWLAEPVSPAALVQAIERARQHRKRHADPGSVAGHDS